MYLASLCVCHATVLYILGALCAAQARPGALATVLLSLAALAALGGGGLTCAALLLLLFFSLRHAGAAHEGVPGAGAARGRLAAAGVPDDVSSEAGCSEASSGTCSVVHCDKIVWSMVACIARGQQR